MQYSFPLAFMANTFAMTILLIVLGLSGHRVMAAEVGVVQAATLALLYAFSANARSLIISKTSGVSAYSVMFGRMALLVPLAAVSFWLSVNVAQVGWLLALMLIVRRCIEWLGEVHLSEMERVGDHESAKKYLVMQSVLLVILLIWLVGNFPFPMWGLFIWAFVPLCFSAGFIITLLRTASNAMTGVIRKMLPNVGSTAIIGITVYVFRLLILLVTEKETAGDLFTAFAIGGMTGSIFANALGASIANHEQRVGQPYFPRMLRHLLNFSFGLGVVILLAAGAKLPIFAWTGKSYFFWKATGLSMIGGGVMVYAQQLRFRLLQHDSEHDVFGPDVLMNILIFASVPFVYYLFGKEAMAGLYLCSSLLAYIFYKSAGKEKREYLGAQIYSPFTFMALRLVIAVLLLLPLFFQIGKGVFADPSVSFDSGGILHNLPIPVSVFSCYTGILLVGAYRRAFLSFGCIFLTCVLMVLSSIVLTQNLPGLQQSKFILLLQYVLPMFALVLGQVYEPVKTLVDDDSMAKAFFWVLIIVVPVQLFFTWQVGLGYLSPRLGLFSVYQFLQYVPVIFVSAFILTLSGLWHLPRYKAALFFLASCMAIYAAASISMLAIALFLGGLILFAIFRLKHHRDKLPLGIFIVALVLCMGYFKYEAAGVQFKFGAAAAPAVLPTISNNDNAVSEAGTRRPPTPALATELPANFAARFKYWNYYIKGISNDATAFLFGMDKAPDRSQYPSAHNYYLDFIYNFGILAMLPMLFLIGMTIFQIYRQRWAVVRSPTLLPLAFIVIFLIIIDNSLKVSFRQPYPGIFSFFLWGVLITKLSKLKSSCPNSKS